MPALSLSALLRIISAQGWIRRLWDKYVMANQKQLSILRKGVEVWNKWRDEHPAIDIDLRKADLRKANLTGIEFSKADLSGAYLIESDLSRAKLVGAKLEGADLSGANLTEANLSRAHLTRSNLKRANLAHARLNRANLTEANLSRTNLNRAGLVKANLDHAYLIGANLHGAHLIRAYLFCADLSKANLTNTNLIHANLSRAKVSNATVTKSKVYGVNVWSIEGDFKEQKELIISPDTESVITVDNIKVAQFLYLILNNEEIRDVINTLTSKSVLILGRFADDNRKAILNALRSKLREYNLLPIVFDFDRPIDRNITEMVKTLAGISYFVIADVTSPKSSPLELQAIVPDYQIPVVPIIQE
jgi:uncharacterized protein YjbI with pentapeptide repeats